MCLECGVISSGTVLYNLLVLEIFAIQICFLAIWVGVTVTSMNICIGEQVCSNPMLIFFFSSSYTLAGHLVSSALVRLQENNSFVSGHQSEVHNSNTEFLQILGCLMTSHPVFIRSDRGVLVRCWCMHPFPPDFFPPTL